MAAEAALATPPEVASPPEGEQEAPTAVHAVPGGEPPAKAPSAGKAKEPKAAKGGKGAKDGKKAKGADAGEPGDGPSVAAHPRAARAVARAKSWGGLLGFILGGYLSLPTNTVAAAGLRALIAGLVCYVAVWAGAVFVWRRLVILEIKSREQQIIAARTGGARRELAPIPRGERPGARGRS
jgi:hypothetical protein